ncbi:hypothetical protein QE152_g37973 [Popillia japonica]|uniref:Uncharacterized protein n=1 Tax=Popillia japonica TaxID=7064 RepID=A0AAW1I8X5_POPJA
MVVQDEAQSYHWASGHVTVHPFVIYYKEHIKVAHTNFVVISDCLGDNTVVGYTFQKELIEFLTAKFETQRTYTTQEDHIKSEIFYSNALISESDNKVSDDEYNNNLYSQTVAQTASVEKYPEEWTPINDKFSEARNQSMYCLS